MSAYKPYPAYKDSGVEWLGEVPEHWEVVPYKYLARIQNGSDHKHIETEEGFPVIGSGGIFAFASDYLYDGESVLLGRKGTIDKPLYVTGKFWAVDTMYWTKIAPDAHGKFAFYAALTIPFSYYSTNTALPSMTKSTLSAHPVVRPPLPEQTTIAAYLDRETAKINALIAAQRRLIDLLREKRSALISHAVTKGLNPDAPMKESGVPWLGKVPEHWVVCRLKHGISEMDSGGTPDTSNTNYWSDNDDGIPWVTIGDMSGVDVVSETSKYVSNSGIQDKGLHLFPKGALLFSMYASLGHVAEIAMCATTNQAILGLVPTRLTLQDFMKRWLQFLQPYLVEIASRNTQANLNAEKVRNLPFVMIGESEQAAIAAYLDRETAKIDILIAKTEKAIELAQERRSALISAAVTGKIDVREAA